MGVWGLNGVLKGINGVKWGCGVLGGINGVLGGDKWGGMGINGVLGAFLGGRSLGGDVGFSVGHKGGYGALQSS